MLRGLRQTRGTRQTKGLRKLRWLTGLSRFKWLRGLTGLMWLLYIVMWLEHHGNRLYGFMGLWSKKWEWVTGVDTP